MTAWKLLYLSHIFILASSQSFNCISWYCYFLLLNSYYNCFIQLVKGVLEGGYFLDMGLIRVIHRQIRSSHEVVVVDRKELFQEGASDVINFPIDSYYHDH